MSVAVSAVIPVKDEAGNVGPLAREIAAGLAGEAHEIIFVDDGSSDGTAQALAALKAELPQLRVLRHDRNLGQSRGIRSGVAAAKGETIVTLDGDGQNDPADIPKLLALLRADPALGMVSGVRVKRVHSGFDQCLNTLFGALTHSNCRTHTQATRGVSGRIGETGLLGDVLDGDQSLENKLIIDHQ